MQGLAAYRYTELEPNAYAEGFDEECVRLISGAAFVPDELELHIVDFGANCSYGLGTIIDEVQRTRAANLAVFDAFFAADQHPEWVRQMGMNSIPNVIMAALLLNTTHFGSWCYSPYVWRYRAEAGLSGCHISRKCFRSAMPVLREYKR